MPSQVLHERQADVRRGGQAAVDRGVPPTGRIGVAYGAEGELQRQPVVRLYSCEQAAGGGVATVSHSQGLTTISPDSCRRGIRTSDRQFPRY